MSIGNALKYGAVGLAADLFAPMLTGGSGKWVGAFAGLFTPDANGMNQAYAPSSFGLGNLLSNIGNVGLGGITAALFGAATILPSLAQGLNNLACFTSPFFAPSIYSTPYSPAGFLPMAWNQGLIQNWGWSAGWLI
ncbi:hypothetical protein L6R52_13760 [Myxococcota bacterium]|nr:hypothetical protein [Myxococcota bacterium]